jgi:hypothetical protein
MCDAGSGKVGSTIYPPSGRVAEEERRSGEGTHGSILDRVFHYGWIWKMRPSPLVPREPPKGRVKLAFLHSQGEGEVYLRRWLREGEINHLPSLRQGC